MSPFILSRLNVYLYPLSLQVMQNTKMYSCQTLARNQFIFYLILYFSTIYFNKQLFKK